MSRSTRILVIVLVVLVVVPLILYLIGTTASEASARDLNRVNLSR